MNTKLPQSLYKEPHRSIIYLISLTLIRAGVQLALYRQGFISVSADEFARGVRAAKWAENPTIDILTDVYGVWLPIEKYINGLALLVWPDVILTPRVTVFIASSFLLITIYLLTYYLFNHVAISILSSLLIAFSPWYTWLSGTPMLEMYYFFCFFTGVLFLIVWLKDERRGYWLWAGLCFLLASGIHVPSWTFINLVNLLTLPYLYKFIKRKDFKNLSRLIAYYIISNGLIISFQIIEFFDTGKVFGFLAKHTFYTKDVYNGYNIPILDKFLYYPQLIIQHTSITIWVSLFIALIFLRRDQDRLWKVSPLLFAALSLYLNSTLNIFSVPTAAAPARYSLIYVIILSFYMAYATYHLFKLGMNFANPLKKYIPIIIATFLFTYSLWWGASHILDYPQGMLKDSLDTGSRLNILMDEDTDRYMVELRYWDYLAINLTSRHYDEMIFDREQDFRNRNTPSIFLQEPDVVCRELLMADLHYVVLQDEGLKVNAQQIEILKPHESIGRWTIYQVIPESERTDDSCQ